METKNHTGMMQKMHVVEIDPIPHWVSYAGSSREVILECPTSKYMCYKSRGHVSIFAS